MATKPVHLHSIHVACVGLRAEDIWVLTWQHADKIGNFEKRDMVKTYKVEASHLENDTEEEQDDSYDTDFQDLQISNEPDAWQDQGHMQYSVDRISDTPIIQSTHQFHLS